MSRRSSGKTRPDLALHEWANNSLRQLATSIKTQLRTGTAKGHGPVLRSASRAQHHGQTGLKRRDLGPCHNQESSQRLKSLCTRPKPRKS